MKHFLSAILITLFLTVSALGAGVEYKTLGTSTTTETSTAVYMGQMIKASTCSVTGTYSVLDLDIDSSIESASVGFSPVATGISTNGNKHLPDQNYKWLRYTVNSFTGTSVTVRCVGEKK